MLLLGGQGPLKIEAASDKGKGGGKPGQSQVSLLEGWVKFKTDAGTAQQIQKLRLGLQTVFQSFCQKSGDIPDANKLKLLDSVAAMLSAKTAGAGGMKRPAPFPADGG